MRGAVHTYYVTCDTCSVSAESMRGDENPPIRHQLDAFNLFRTEGWIVDGKGDHTDTCPSCRAEKKAKV